MYPQTSLYKAVKQSLPHNRNISLGDPMLSFLFQCLYDTPTLQGSSDHLVLQKHVYPTNVKS